MYTLHEIRFEALRHASALVPETTIHRTNVVIMVADMIMKYVEGGEVPSLPAKNARGWKGRYPTPMELGKVDRKQALLKDAEVVHHLHRPAPIADIQYEIKEMLEDYEIPTKQPERRVFHIDVGSLTSERGREIIQGFLAEQG